MRRALRRAGWALAAAGGLGLAAPGAAQPPAIQMIGPAGHSVESGEPVAVVTEAQTRLEGTLVELAWLADPFLFSYSLGAHASGETLEARGFLPNQAARERALKIAREKTSLRVVDKFQVHPTLAVRTSVAPPEQVQRAAKELLEESFAPHGRGMEVHADARGRVTVTGKVPSYEEKLAVSRKLRRVPGCSCVENKLEVATTVRDGKPHVLITADGQHTVVTEVGTPDVAPEPAPRVVLQPPPVPEVKEFIVPKPPEPPVPEAVAPKPPLPPVKEVVAPKPPVTHWEPAPQLTPAPAGTNVPTPSPMSEPAVPPLPPPVPEPTRVMELPETRRPAQAPETKPLPPVRSSASWADWQSTAVRPDTVPEKKDAGPAPLPPPVVEKKMPDPLPPLVVEKKAPDPLPPPVEHKAAKPLSPPSVTAPTGTAPKPVELPVIVNVKEAPAQQAPVAPLPPVKMSSPVTAPPTVKTPDAAPRVTNPGMTPPAKPVPPLTPPPLPPVPPDPGKAPTADKKPASSEAPYVTTGVIIFSNDEPAADKPVASVTPRKPAATPPSPAKPTSAASPAVPAPLPAVLTKLPAAAPTKPPVGEPPVAPAKPAASAPTTGPVKPVAHVTPAAPVKPVPLTTAELKKRIEAACGKSVRDLQVTLKGDKHVQISFKTSSQDEARRVWERISVIPELARYKVDASVGVVP